MFSENANAPVVCLIQADDPACAQELQNADI
jgi:hypothetical protein